MKLSLLDSVFFLFERHESPKHVAGLQVFELPEGRGDDFVAELAQTLRGSTVTREPFNLRPAWSLTGLRWEEVEVDVAEHVHHERLPAPGTMAQLEAHIGYLHEPLLDRNRPVWEVHLIEGLEGRRFALYTKIHHSYGDGITLSGWTLRQLTTDGNRKEVQPIWSQPEHHPGDESEVTRKSFRELVGERAAQLKKQLSIYPDLYAYGAKVVLQELGLRKSHLAVPFGAPRTILNRGAVSAARGTITAAIPLKDIKAVCAATGTTINDIVLTVCDLALQRYMEEQDMPIDEPLLLQMPISLAARDGNAVQNQQQDGGNKVALAFLNLGTEKDPLERLDQIQESSREVKEEYIEAVSPEAAMALAILVTGIAQTAEATGMDQYLPRAGNVVISNVPGPRKALYFGGARMMALYPLSVLLPGMALNITVYSYDGTLFFGMTGSRDALPGMDEFSPYIRDAFAALRKKATAKKQETGERGGRKHSRQSEHV